MRSLKVKDVLRIFAKLNKTEIEEFVSYLDFNLGFIKKSKKSIGGIDFKIGPDLPKRSDQMIEKTITNEGKYQVTINPASKAGKPAKFDGKPTWTVTSGNSTLDVADDGMSAFIVSSDQPGDTIVLVDGDADLGEGVVDVQDTILTHVIGAMATSLGLIAGDEVPK